MKTVRSGAWLVAFSMLVTAGAGGCSRFGGGGSATPKTEDDKTLYALGLVLGRNIQVFNLTAKELDMVKAGLTDGVTKKKAAVDVDAYRPKIDALARGRAGATAEQEKGRSKSAIEAAAREPGAIKTPSGMVIRTTKPGNGPSPAATDRVKVHYEGHLTDGTVFDSSRKRGEPATFPLNGVIKCWTEGVGRMKVGEQATLTCPSDLAYGDNGRPPTIPGGATLIFDVELLEIVKLRFNVSSLCAAHALNTRRAPFIVKGDITMIGFILLGAGLFAAARMFHLRHHGCHGGGFRRGWGHHHLHRGPWGGGDGGWGGDEEPWEHGGGGFGGPGRHGGRVFMRALGDRLDASPAQERVIRDAFGELRDTAAKLRGEGKSTRADVASAFRRSSFDAETFGELFARHDRSLEELRKAFVGAGARIHDALDEKQRNRLADLIESGPGRWWRGGRRDWV
jgi:FKBP-type peptidyl-prolyl cis-trans isomerase FkpA